MAARHRDPLDDPGELVRRVYAYVAYRIGDGPDAEDVTSETFTRALRYRDSYRHDKGEPIAWLIGIARRVLAEYTGRALQDVVYVDRRGEAAEPVDDWIRDIDLHDAIRALEPHDRELIGLRYGADLTARQIATVLGLRTNAVEVALHRALARLRAVITTRAPDGQPSAAGRLDPP